MATLGVRLIVRRARVKPSAGSRPDPVDVLVEGEPIAGVGDKNPRSGSPAGVSPEARAVSLNRPDSGGVSGLPRVLWSRVAGFQMSSKARGLTAETLGELTVTMAPPTRLVELAFKADGVLTY